MIQVHEFTLAISAVASGFVVRARSTHAGETAPSVLTLPFDLQRMPAARRSVATWIQQARVTKLRGSPELAQARRLGAALFRALFAEELLAAFRSGRAALGAGERMLLRLVLPPALIPLPWELLYDARDEQFLVLAPDLTVVRALELPQAGVPVRIGAQLRVVAVLASPTGADYPPIRVERELRRLEVALQKPIQRGQITLDVIRGPDTLGQLRTRLRTPAHVIHILCHGDLDTELGEGVLVFEDAESAPEPVSAELLRLQLQKQRGQTQLVVLNACLGALPGGDDPFSGVGASLLRGGVPAVIAMQFEIAEDSASELTRMLYSELAAGVPLGDALAETRLHLYGRFPTQLDWAIPVLMLRTEDSQIFEMVGRQPTDKQSRPPRFGQERWSPLAVGAVALALLLVLIVWAVGHRGSTANLGGLGEPMPGPATAIAATEQATAPAQPGAASAGAGPAAAGDTPAPAPLSAVSVGPVANVTNSLGASTAPLLAVDTAGTLHLTWTEDPPQQKATRLYTQLGADRAWGAPKDLTADFGDLKGSDALVLAPDGTLCTFWFGADASNHPYTWALRQRCLNESGWTPAELVWMDALHTSEFAVAFAPDGRVHAVSSGLAGGASIGKRPLLEKGFANDLAFTIDTAGRYHVVWNAGPNLQYRASPDGQTWSDATTLTDKASFLFADMLVADRQNKVHLLWGDGNDIYYQSWMAEMGWSDAQLLTEEYSRGSQAALAVDAQGLPHIVWSGQRGVFYSHLSADGQWAEAAQIAKTGASATIAVGQQGEVHVVWTDFASEESDVFYTTVRNE